MYLWQYVDEWTATKRTTVGPTSVCVVRAGIGFYLGGIKYASGRHRTTTFVVNYCAPAHVHLFLHIL